MDGWMYIWMNGWTDGWMDALMNKRTDSWIEIDCKMDRKINSGYMDTLLSSLLRTNNRILHSRGHQIMATI